MYFLLSLFYWGIKLVVLVTGVTGFLGGVHLKNLIENNDFSRKDLRVLIMEHEDPTPFIDKGIDVFVGDLAFPESLSGIMKDVLVVYHIAAIPINEAANRDVMMRTNYGGTIKLAEEFLREESTEKFVYASTFGVYGMQFPKHPVAEDYLKNPDNNYQESKYLAEKHLLSLAKEQDLNVTSIRNSLILGPGDKVTSFRIANGLLNNQIFYLGHGRYLSSYVDARDSSEGMILATKTSKAKGEAYNIKSFDISQKEIFDLYAKACGGCYPSKKYPVFLAYLFAWFKEKTTKKGEESLVSRTRVKRYTNNRLLDTTKIEKDLGYQPQHTNKEKVINESIDWLVKNNLLTI